MAVFATPRNYNLCVADEAISHLRHRRRRDLLGLLQATVTGLARILGIEVSPNVPGWLEVNALIDGPGQYRRQIADLQMHRMAEMHHRNRQRRRPLWGD